MADEATNAPEQQGGRAATVRTPLSHWNELIEGLLLDGRPDDALPAIRVVLKRLPRHLASYQRLLQVAWLLQRWNEGYDWGARLLRADPGNPLAWRAVAMAVEQRGHRARARAIWQRAFEMHPYEPDIRAGVYRTSLREPEPLGLNHACLAVLSMRVHNWRRAVQLYAALVEANPQRNDFRTYCLVAMWQSGAHRDAYRLARQLVQRERYLLLPWVVLNALGDHNDRALALDPIQSMDPDGEYMQGWFGVDLSRPSIQITVTAAEAELLDTLL